VTEKEPTGIAYYLALAQQFKHRKAQTSQARAQREAQKDAHVARALALRAEGLSAPMIGIRMAADEGKAEPYSERTVRRWLSAGVPKKG
jgi:membrane protein required for beta-lactamase induction